MERYGNELYRPLAVVIVIAAVIASSFLIAAYYTDQPVDPTTTTTTTTEGFYPGLPTAPLTIIVDSGSQGSQIVGNLEFGFNRDSSGYTVGVNQDWLQIHNGFNKTEIAGLGFSEERVYGFAYNSELQLMDDWLLGSPSGVYSSDQQPAWTPNSRSGHGVGVPQMSVTNLTNAGYVVEFIDLKVYLKGRSNIDLNLASLAVGANFTRVGDDWQVTYIFEVSGTGSVTFGTDSITIELEEEIPDKTDTTTTTTTTIPSSQNLVLSLIGIPATISLAVIIVLVVYARKNQ